MSRFLASSPFRFLALVWLIAAQAPAAAMELKDAHSRLGLECQACHGNAQSPRKPAAKACLACHGSYAELAKTTAKIEPNPHQSHLGDLRCTYCHASHGESRIYCNECHQFPNLKLP